MTPTRLLPRPALQRFACAVAACAGGLIVLGGASGTAHDGDADAPSLLAQATKGDAVDRRASAARAWTMLRADPAVRFSRRIPPDELRAGLRTLGAGPDDLLTLPETVEARLLPGTDPDASARRLRALPGVTITAIAPATPPGTRRWTRLAGVPIIAVGAALAAGVAWLDVARRRTALAMLHRLGASRMLVGREALAPTLTSSAGGLAAAFLLAAGGGWTSLLQAQGVLPILLLACLIGASAAAAAVRLLRDLP